MPDGQPDERLQIVCASMWNKLPGNPTDLDLLLQDLVVAMLVELNNYWMKKSKIMLQEMK